MKEDVNGLVKFLSDGQYPSDQSSPTSCAKERRLTGRMKEIFHATNLSSFLCHFVFHFSGSKQNYWHRKGKDFSVAWRWASGTGSPGTTVWRLQPLPTKNKVEGNRHTNRCSGRSCSNFSPAQPASPPFFYLSLARPWLKCSANGKGKGEAWLVTVILPPAIRARARQPFLL